jgi:hypothetical protein
MGFKVHIDEEYGYREYVVIINGMTIEQFKAFVLGEDIEQYFFHSGGLFHVLQQKFEGVSCTCLPVAFGKHPLYGEDYGLYILKEEHAEDADEDVSVEDYPMWFVPFKRGSCPVSMHCHMKDDSYIKIGDTYHRFDE